MGETGHADELLEVLGDELGAVVGDDPGLCSGVLFQGPPVVELRAGDANPAHDLQRREAGALGAPFVDEIDHLVSDVMRSPGFGPIFPFQKADGTWVKAEYVRPVVSAVWCHEIVPSDFRRKDCWGLSQFADGRISDEHLAVLRHYQSTEVDPARMSPAFLKWLSEPQS